VLGKILAASFFMTLSLALTLSVFTASLGYVRLESLGMAANFGPRIALVTFALMLPFVACGCGAVSWSPRSRAATAGAGWLTVVLLGPTIPDMCRDLQLQARAGLNVDSPLSQHLLIDALLAARACQPPLRRRFLRGLARLRRAAYLRRGSPLNGGEQILG